MANDSLGIDKSLIERGYWIATHRIFLRKWLSISLYAVVGIAYVFFFVQFGIYMFRYTEWNQLMVEARRPQMDWKALQEERVPLELEFGRPVVIPIGDSRYDFAVEVYNPNTQWAVASVKYRFLYGDGDATPEMSTFILPGDRKYLTTFAFRSLKPISNVIDVDRSGYQWQKLTKLPPLSWNFTEQPAFTPQQTIVEAGTERIIPAHVAWTVQNSSTLNLRTVVWQVALLSGNRVVGILSHRAENMTFLQERHFDIVVPEAIARVEAVKVYPIVDIFDPGFTYLR